MKTEFIDLDGREIELGHVLAVRYAWNSYAGIVAINGLSFKNSVHGGFAEFHPLSKTATYQILGHEDPEHKDYNKMVIKWLTEKDHEPPIKIRVYENMPPVS